MPRSTIRFKHATVAVVSQGVTHEFDLGEGNVTYEESREIEFEYDKGNLEGAIEGDEQPLQASISGELRHITGPKSNTNAPVDPFDHVAHRDGTTCYLRGVDIKIEYSVTGCAGNDEIVYLPYFHWESKSVDLAGKSFDVSGRCSVSAPTPAAPTASPAGGTYPDAPSPGP